MAEQFNPKKILVLIPARFQSSRFPGKPLALIAGKSMIEHVYTNVVATGFDVRVVTDDERIEQAVVAFGGKVLRVDDDVISGTERINLAFARHFKTDSYDLVINVQGDEPLLMAEELLSLAKFHLASNFHITTLVKKTSIIDSDYQNPNRVKVIYSKNSGQCFYFSRASIPFIRPDGASFNNDQYWFLHIGVYSYRPIALRKFSELSCSYYESLEKLEQLRAIEAGMLIGAIETKRELLGVDTPEDLIKLEEILRERK